MSRKIQKQKRVPRKAPRAPVRLASRPSREAVVGAVELRLRELGARLNIPRVHPHKFRRTTATNAIDKGMPIEQVQRLLGHKKIDDALRYATAKRQNVKIAHRKFIG
ncbi:MAG: site-specific integrase [Thermoguttaceae bacterium]|nr:site-specific integrase [Thermoguttaceae bacterium]